MASRTTSWTSAHLNKKFALYLMSHKEPGRALSKGMTWSDTSFSQTAPQQCRGPGALLGSCDIAHMGVMRLWVKAKVVATERRGRIWETEEINKQSSVTNGVGLGREGAQLVASHTSLTNRNTRHRKKRVKQGFRAKGSYGIQPF